MTFDPISTLLIAALVLLIGQQMVKRITFLREFNIPIPVVGGLLATIVVTLLRGFGYELQFAAGLQTPFMLLFFASVGLSANIKLIASGGRTLFIFLALVVGLLISQNLLGMSLAKVMGIEPVLGLIAGSITMSGGHGTGIAWASVFADQYGVESAYPLAMAAATFGLVFGSIIGGPTASILIKRARKQGHEMAPDSEKDVEDVTSDPQKVTTDSFIHMLACLLISTVVGSFIASVTKDSAFSLPAFVWVLFSGVLIGNVARMSRLYNINDSANDMLGNLALSLFLALALMNLKLWDLAGLALPILVILVCQVVLVFLYTTQFTFRVLGSNYSAAVLVAGQCGFAMGATPTAIANMQAVTDRFGPSRLAFIIVPVVGGFLVDIANALVIKGFLLFA